MDLAEKIIKAMEGLKYEIFRNPGEINIVYLEGANADGTPNDDKPNKFNDQRIVITFKDGKPVIIGQWQGTTEPGFRWTQRPMNPKGAARIKFGQYKAWQLGIHHFGKPSAHEALVQTGGTVTVYRDYNKDYQREGDKLDTGFFAINQHHGYDLPEDDLGASSAGCLVGRTKKGHQEFMKIVKTDPRFLANKKFVFSATVMPAKAIA